MNARSARKLFMLDVHNAVDRVMNGHADIERRPEGLRLVERDGARGWWIQSFASVEAGLARLQAKGLVVAAPANEVATERWTCVGQDEINRFFERKQP